MKCSTLYLLHVFTNTQVILVHILLKISKQKYLRKYFFCLSLFDNKQHSIIIYMQ